MAIEHNVITDPELHEPKGISTATTNQVYIANGSGSGVWTTAPWSLMEMGWWDYHDVTTTGTPIPLTLANTDYQLTNDGAGADSNDLFALTGINDLWDTVSNQFDFSGLSVGDTVDLRIDLEFTTTSANSFIDVSLELDSAGTPFLIPILVDEDIDAAGTYREVRQIAFYIGSEEVRDNGARLLSQSDKTGVTVTVNGWFVRGIRRG